MENRNGYFQVIRSENGISIRLVPETGAGKKIKPDEIKEYLKKNGITNGSYGELERVLNDLSREETVWVSPYMGNPINESVKVTISADGMEAGARFYPPSNDGKRRSAAELKKDLNAAGVVYGIDERIIASHLKNPLYCTDFIIARGKKAVDGTNAAIEYLFNTDRHMRPKRNEDGSVDFHQLDNISHIKAGDTLAVLHPEKVGEIGTNVRGADVRPHPVEHKMLKFGKNIELSPDKRRLISKINGHAVLEGERVFVSNIYDVPGDVDNSTGDINYEGNVLVHGNVRTGFRVRAAGDIEVCGSVEGAELIAGGNIILHHGMQGMTRGKVIAKGNVICKFIESVRVFAEGYVEAEGIIQSQVSAKGDINVNGQKGQIIGGYIRSASCISAKRIGSGMGITTIVEVGFDPAVQDRMTQLKELLADKNAEYKQCLQIVELLNKKLNSGMINALQKNTLEDNIRNAQRLREEIFTAQGELDEIMAKVSENSDSCIKVYGGVYPGTQLRISGDFYNINEEFSYCKFYKLNGEIRTGVL